MIAKLEKERDAALQLAFRKKVERYVNDRQQFVLDFGDSPEVADAAAGIADAALEMVGSYERRKPATEKPRSEALPAHLPRYEVKLITPQEMPDFDPGNPKSARAREVIAAALEPRRASVTARMWAYKSVTAPINLFDFTVIATARKSF